MILAFQTGYYQKPLYVVLICSLGLQYGNYKQQWATRKISFKPSDISTNHVRNYLIPDIMQRATDVNIGDKADTSSIIIFWDV